MDVKFKDRWILVVDDQPLVALDIADSLTKAGATTTLQEGLRLAEHPRLSAASSTLLWVNTTMCRYASVSLPDAYRL